MDPRRRGPPGGDVRRPSDPFFCLPVDGKSTSVPEPPPIPGAHENHCPPNQERYGNVEPCNDYTLECRPDTCDDADLPEDGGVACPPQLRQGPRQFACGAAVNGDVGVGKALAVQSLVAQAAIHGGDEPTDAPARYCYLSCFDNTFTRCDPDQFAPTAIAGSTIVAGVDPQASAALLTVVLDGQAELTELPVFGTIAIDVPEPCIGPLPDGETASCQSILPHVSLHGLSPFIVVADETLSAIQLTNPRPIFDDTVTIGDGSIFALPSDLELYVSADIADHGPTGVAYQPNTAIIGSIDWTTRAMTVLASFDDPEGTSSLTLALSAPIPNLPPAADAGPDQIVECGGPGGTEGHHRWLFEHRS